MTQLVRALDLFVCLKFLVRSLALYVLKSFSGFSLFLCLMWNCYMYKENKSFFKKVLKIFTIWIFIENILLHPYTKGFKHAICNKEAIWILELCKGEIKIYLLKLRKISYRGTWLSMYVTIHKDPGGPWSPTVKENLRNGEAVLQVVFLPLSTLFLSISVTI